MVVELASLGRRVDLGQKPDEDVDGLEPWGGADLLDIQVYPQRARALPAPKGRRHFQRPS